MITYNRNVIYFYKVEYKNTNLIFSKISKWMNILREVKNSNDLAHNTRFLYDKRFLYLACIPLNESAYNVRKEKKNIKFIYRKKK